MALTPNCIRFLFYAKQQGVSFQHTLMLGRLKLYADRKDIEHAVQLFDNADKNLADVKFPDEYSEPLFEILGSLQTDSMDYSNYEKATLIQDLNKPVPDSLKEKFSVIVDGGTIEHVFNFPQAIKNCMEMVAPGGHYLGITPVNNTMGHGFYQFSPELYFNIFRKENGFEVKKIIMYVQYPDGRCSDWYEVMDPHTVKNRVMLTNSNPTYMMIIAQRTAITEIFSMPPQQSDYETLWAIKESLSKNEKPAKEGKLKYLYRKAMPRPLKILLRNTYDLFTKENVVNEDLGKINELHFRKIKLK